MRGKLARFRDNHESPNVLEPGNDMYEKIRGKWKDEFFKNDNELVVELGCGKGEYTVGLGRLCPNRNFIGVDKKGDRIWVGSQTGLNERLDNIGFLRTEMIFLEKFFKEDEVDEFWLTFPDPRPKLREEKRRLTYPTFLDMYKKDFTF